MIVELKHVRKRESEAAKNSILSLFNCESLDGLRHTDFIRGPRQFPTIAVYAINKKHYIFGNQLSEARAQAAEFSMSI